MALAKAPDSQTFQELAHRVMTPVERPLHHKLFAEAELDKLLPKGKPPPRRLTGIGRNCDLFRSMVSEVFRPRWAGILGAQGHSGAWLEHVRRQNASMFPNAFLPDSECRSIAKSCYRYWTRHYSPGRFSEIQRSRMGKRWHGDLDFDFEKQSVDVRELKAIGLTQASVGAVLGRSSGCLRVVSLGFCHRAFN